ncbi:MAG TPA: hypothetical protein VFS67_20135 [Polyangiaceae bacterium]|nr:hypothetical protein [Polyangiaceae bacterium]
MKHYLRNAIRLGTSLTALFLLVRCGVPERDYSKLGIGQNAGSAGESGAGSDVVLHSSAGQGGGGSTGNSELEDAGSEGGSAGAPPAPIPCDPVSTDAGSEDAGTSDAGTDAGLEDAGVEDAGAEESLCACVDGFIQAVDTDGDGDGTRACTVAPGLDCDDSDPAVTHNACGGCGVLPNAIGEDCGDCGVYACDGPEGVKCVSKPGPVEDPDCRCVAGLIVAKDTDNDGAGTKLCEQNPGPDCDDGNGSFITNACGGCGELANTVGADCHECGVWTCNGGALGCVPKTGAGGQQCLPDNKTRLTCISDGYWDTGTLCANVCYQGACEACMPGTFRCTFYTTGDAIQKCFDSASYGINWWSWGSCLTPGQLRCEPTNGTCHGSLLLPRDGTFDLVPSQRNGLPWHDLLNTALDSEYG